MVEEFRLKNESLSKLKDCDVRNMAHDARKEVKGTGQKFLQAIQAFVSADEVWNKVKAERAELKSNLDLIKEIEEGNISLEEEKEAINDDLAESR